MCAITHYNSAFFSVVGVAMALAPNVLCVAHRTVRLPWGKLVGDIFYEYSLVYGLSLSHQLQQMAQFFFFGTQITPGRCGWRNHQRDTFDYLNTHFFEREHLLWIV